MNTHSKALGKFEPASGLAYRRLRNRITIGLGVVLFMLSMVLPESYAYSQGTTTTGLTSSLNPATFGQSVTFTATVSSPTGTPAGKVAFMNGSATLGSVTLSGGVATITKTTLTIGARSITAVYAGNAKFSGSTSPVLTEQVVQATSSVSLTSSLNPATFGQSVTFTATVSSPTGTPAGKVAFMNGSATLGSVTLSGGVATITKTTLPVGVSSITAVYAGNATFSGSTSPVLTEQVGQATSSVSLTSSLNPATFGQPVTFTATVSSPAGTPTGKVVFMNGSATVGSVTLAGGVGALSTSSLPSGILTITSSYAGSKNFSSASANLTQRVNSTTSMGYTLAAQTLNPNWFTPGSTSTSAITVTPSSGYTGTVSLSCSVTGGGSPAPSCSFNPSSVTVGGVVVGASTLTVSTSSSTGLSNYLITVSGSDTNNLAPHNGNQTLTLNAVPAGSPSYILSATALTPSSVIPGGTAASTITVYPANGYAGSVALSCGIISGGNFSPLCSFSPSSVTLNGSAAATSTLTVSTANSTPGNNYIIPVDASDANSLAPINGSSTLMLNTQSVIQHVIVLFQENRTPDNLFQDPVLIAAGADIAANGINSQGQVIPLSPIDLGTAGANPQYYDLLHTHASFLSMYDGGKMDGADLIPCDSYSVPNCPPNAQFMYVTPADVQPYFAMAEQYTFGDRMFETSQSGSYPAHQFIISGTSAPSAGSPLFVAGGATDNDAGCTAVPGTIVQLIDPNGNPASPIYPCFEHPVLSDLLDAQGLTWHYYYSTSATSIWTAPNSIEHMCQEQNINGVLLCEAPEWHGNVINPATQVLTDIANGQLPQVSWVIPPGAYSDHAHSNNGGGPAWVSSIVNAIGNSPYWANTTIIVTWDDWGGWYDHVAPKIINDGVSWGSGFVYGFRVPLIVMSPYAKAGYISHVTHDFGSILKYIETNFNLPSLGYADAYADDLSDCFDLSQAPIPFRAITAAHDATYFIHDKTPVTAPDDD